MFDTVRLHHPRPMPSAPELLQLGFVSLDGRNDGRSPKWVKNPPKGSCEPRLTYSNRDAAGSYLIAEVSLPKFLFGNNIKEIEPNHIELTLSDFGEYVEQAARVEFDARTALVGRADYCRNYQLENETQVRAYIKAFQCATLPKYSRRCENDTTVTLRSRSREVTLYSKHDELKYRKAIPELLELSEGVLRFEPRFLSSGACRALANRFGVDRTAVELLSPDVWRSVMQRDISRVSLDKPILTRSSLLDKVVRVFGYIKGYKYYTFLCARELHGDDFWRYHGLSQATYYRIQKELREKGLWLVSDAIELPPLPVASGSLSLE